MKRAFFLIIFFSSIIFSYIFTWNNATSAIEKKGGRGEIPCVCTSATQSKEHGDRFFFTYFLGIFSYFYSYIKGQWSNYNRGEFFWIDKNVMMDLGEDQGISGIQGETQISEGVRENRNSRETKKNMAHDPLWGSGGIIPHTPSIMLR